MTLTSVPNSIWRVNIDRSFKGTLTSDKGIFTTRDEVRTHRASLRSQGVATAQMTTVRYAVSAPTTVSV